MKDLFKIFALSLFTLSIVGCKKDSIKANYSSKVQGNADASVASLQSINTSSGELGVVELPSTVDAKIRATFKWYTQVTAPNGRRIHMLAQSNWSVEKVAYTRTVLEHYLANNNSIIYGNKDEVANSVANQNGAMTMFNDANSVSNNSSGVTGQDLQADETVVIGSSEYLNQSVRNAALEEILHFVHDLGISSTYPQLQKELETATANAVDNHIFIPWGGLPVADYDNELLAAYNDAYWGLVEYKTTTDNPYLFLSREAAIAGDPLSTSVLEKFLPKYFTSTMSISSDFSGTFSLVQTAGDPYTNESQYYKNVQLIGSLSSSILGNDLDNSFTGNAGNNTLDGGSGVDVAVFSGNFSEYSITTIGGTTSIVDGVSNRDGADELINIEKAQFLDQTINL
jgi:Ca2+-binding RTX toxin-like protein